MGTMGYSAAGMAMTKQFEGLRLEAYQDAAKVWTVGYGHTGPDVKAGMVIDEAQAEVLLRADLTASVDCVNAAVKTEISQRQFDALVDFCFNAGRGHFLRSTLLRFVNQRKWLLAQNQFGFWVNAGGRPLPGLIKRRAAEAAMFASGSPKPGSTTRI